MSIMFSGQRSSQAKKLRDTSKRITAFFCRAAKIHIEHFFFHDKGFYSAVSLLGLFFLIFIGFSFYQFFRPQFLRISFYDIGQGDAAFIETPERFQMLIDGGPDGKILEKLNRDMPFYDRTIDLIIATHPNADHIAGLVDVLERYRVGILLLPRVENHSAVYEKLLREAQKENVPIRELWGIEDMIIDKNIDFKILNPLRGQKYENDNDFGIAGLLTYNRFRSLFTADISKSIEEKIVKFLPKSITILKVAHHGSRYSSSFNFLKSIHPKLSVISVGKNHYGHPAIETLQNLASVGTSIWRTDENKDLRIISDGETYWIGN